MQRRPTSSSCRRQTGALAALAGAVLALASCSGDNGVRIQNIPPHVRLTGGPIQGDSVSYRAEFFWTGWDDDGIVDRYQYAVDVPDSLLGNLDDPDERRIAWVDTTATRAGFLFSTSVQDSVLMPDLTYRLPDRFRGDHHFYVRAIDNEGAFSRADKVGFTARTITPLTTITRPRLAPTATFIDVGRRIYVAWTGVDPDNPDPARRPAFYEWKLIPGIGSNPAGINVQYAVTVHPGPQYPWTRARADSTSLQLDLKPPEEYVLAIRAIDEAGGVESKFYNGQNALILVSWGTHLSEPLLRVRESALGSFTFPNDGLVWEVEVPVGLCLTFQLSADARSYGEEIEGFNWGVDVENDASLHGWSKVPHTDPICFQEPGTHTVTVMARDTGGGVIIGTIVLTVIAFPMDRDVLYVDDFSLGQSGPLVGDAMMDGRARAMIEAAGVPADEIDQLDVFGPGDMYALPTPLKLSDLARYKLVVWSCWGVGYAGQTALVNASACGRTLQTYVEAGGAVWIYGRQLFGAFKRFSAASCMGTLGYDATSELNFTGDEFPVEFMGITPGGFRCAKTDRTRDGLLRAQPTAEARAELFPAVEIDSTVFTPSQGGLVGVDAMFTPAYAAGLDTLYTMETPRSSMFNGKPVAFRYLDPDPGSTQGPVAVFGFPFHQLKQGSAAERTGVSGMARSMIDWFRQHGKG